MKRGPGLMLTLPAAVLSTAVGVFKGKTLLRVR